MHEILPNLYLSGYHNIKLQNKASTFIVNCTKDLPMYCEKGIYIAVDDDGSKEALDGMFNKFSEVADRIHQELQNGSQVVVHCLAGQQRSPAMVAAYLMKHRGYTLENAVRHIRAKKPDAFFWSINFLDPLQRYAMMLGKL